MLDTYTRWLIRHPGRVVASAVVLCLVCAAGMSRLAVTNDMRAYFSQDNPQLAAFDALEAVYDRQDSLLFFVVAHEGDLFTPELLGLVHELTELGWQAPYSRRVDSLANFQHTRAEGDDLFVADLVSDPAALDAGSARELRAVALSEPTLVGRMVSANGRAAGVIVTLALPEGNLKANDEVTLWARERLDVVRARHPGALILLGGTAATNMALGEAVERDISTLVVLSYAVIVLGLLLLLRHLAGAAVTVALVTLSVAATMGVFGWAGTTLESVSGFVPSVVMTIAVADSVHLLVTYYYELRRGRSQSEAVREALRVNAAPILLTSVTTVIGVLSLNFSDSPPYRELGNMVAVGVAFAWLLSMTFLPALLLRVPLRHPGRGRALAQAMDAFANGVIRHRRALLVGMGALVLTLAAFIPRNVLGERWHEYFDASFEVRRTVDAVARHLGGLHVIRYSLESGREHGIHEPAYLRDVAALAQWLRGRPDVSHVTAITDTMRRISRDLHGGDPDWFRLPESRELAAQYLLLYELSLPQGLGLENAVDVTRSATQLTLLARRTDSEALIDLDRTILAWAAEHTPGLGISEGTSVDMIFAHINHRNIRGLLQGMVLALALISLLLVFALRSVKLGLLSLVTNLAPAGLAYGVWGLLVGRIDLSASVVMCMSIGIVVDDTVHFLSKYLRARRESGLDAASSLRYAFNTVGAALLITTTVLVAGFLVLAASHFSPSMTTGILLALTLALALVVDFLFMPPLLLLVDADPGSRP